MASKVVVLWILFHLFEERKYIVLGKRKNNSQTGGGDKWRIVGGKLVTKAAEYPYMVSIQACVTGSSKCPELDQQHRCGGALLSAYYVITACHCVADLEEGGTGPARKKKWPVKAYVFVAGTSNIIKRGPHTQIRFATQLLHHPKCATIQGSVVYDLGLAKMEKPFQINKHVKPLKFFYDDSDLQKKLVDITIDSFKVVYVPITSSSTHKYPHLSTKPLGQLLISNQPGCTVTGWGEVRPGQFIPSKSSEVMNVVTMYVIPETDCLVAYSKRDKLYNHFSFKEYFQICAVSRYGNESDCVGDSGSPVVCDGYMIGVVSYGFECGEVMPSVYQTTATLNSWLSKDIIKKSNRHKSIFSEGFYSFNKWTVAYAIFCFLSCILL